MNRFKLLFLLLFCCEFLYAQEKHELRLIYIDHEVTTPVNKVCDALKQARNDALESEGYAQLVIYLSTGLEEDRYGLLSYTNLEDSEGRDYDSDAAFNMIIAALQNANYHSVNPTKDVENLTRLFDLYHFVGENNELNVTKMTIDFFVGQNFWLLGYNHKVISHFNSDVALYALPKEKLDMNIKIPKGVTLKYKDGELFGEMNVQDINNSKYIHLNTY